MSEIRTADELRELLGAPLPSVVAKESTVLLDEHRAWLAASPLCMLATSAADGSCDVSPKGDPPGSLTHVIDERTIAIAERPGNRRTDGYLNMLSNPHIGLLFVIPGRGDTLRINGTARLLRTDRPGGPEYVESMVVKGHRPLVVCEVNVEQVFFHCAKAFLRSRLWHPETWAPDQLPSRAEIAKSAEHRTESLRELEEYYGEQYAKHLY